MLFESFNEKACFVKWRLSWEFCVNISIGGVGHFRWCSTFGKWPARPSHYIVNSEDFVVCRSRNGDKYRDGFASFIFNAFHGECDMVHMRRCVCLISLLKPRKMLINRRP